MTISLVRRGSGSVILVLALMAVPVGALCGSCCPESETTAVLEAATPCCGGCEPEVANAKPPVPALGAARVTLDRPSLAAASADASPCLESRGSLPISVSPSPPDASPPASSILRL